MNAIARLALPLVLSGAPAGTTPALAHTVRRFLEADRRYDEGGPHSL